MMQQFYLNFIKVTVDIIFLTNLLSFQDLPLYGFACYFKKFQLFLNKKLNVFEEEKKCFAIPLYLEAQHT